MKEEEKKDVVCQELNEEELNLATGGLEGLISTSKRLVDVSQPGNGYYQIDPNTGGGVVAFE